MWEVLDVLRRVHRGEAKAAIERVTGRCARRPPPTDSVFVYDPRTDTWGAAPR